MPLIKFQLSVQERISWDFFLTAVVGISACFRQATDFCHFKQSQEMLNVFWFYRGWIQMGSSVRWFLWQISLPYLRISEKVLLGWKTDLILAHESTALILNNCWRLRSVKFQPMAMGQTNKNLIFSYLTVKNSHFV